MNTDINQIDRIVREVLRRLDQKPASQTTLPNATPTDTGPSSTLRIDDRLITAGALNGRLHGIRRVEVRRDAIVTPLVKDLLKEKQIDLQWTVSQRDNDSREICRSRRCWLLVEQGDGEAEATLRMKAEDGLQILTGKMNPMVAMGAGKLRVEGNVQRLMILQSV